MASRAIVLGAGGQIGRALIELLIREGWKVSGTRTTESQPLQDFDPGRLTISHVDHNDDRALLALVGDGADVLFDVSGYDARRAKQLIKVSDVLGSIVTVSSASVYRDPESRSLDESDGGFPTFPEPITEETPTVPAADGTYSERKVAMEQTLLQNSNIPVAILRPCAVYGIGSRHPREWWFVKRVLDGRAIVPLAHSGRSRFHTSSAAYIALVGLRAAAARYAGPINVGDHMPPSVEQIAKSIAAHFAHSWRLFYLGDEEGTNSVGATPWSVPRPYILNTQRARELAGAEPSYVEGLGQYLDWLIKTAALVRWETAFSQLAAYPPKYLFDYNAEDKFIARVGDHE